MAEKELVQERPSMLNETEKQELVSDASLWFPVTVSSRKHGGGLRVFSGQPIRAEQRPEDTRGDTKKMQCKTRYFGSWQEAQRIMSVIQSLDITTERVRFSVTQGEVKVYINGKYIVSFSDRIVLVLPECRDGLDYYGDNFGGWRSSKPDSSFVLGLIWHPFDHVYHYSEKVCQILGITQVRAITGIVRDKYGEL